MSKHSVLTKVVGGVTGSIGLVNTAVDWPLCFVTSGVSSAMYGKARERCESTIQYIKSGLSFRVKLVAAGVLAPFDSEKSDELYDEALEDQATAETYLHDVTSPE